MRPNYKPDDLQQDTFVPICFENAFHHLMDRVDLPAFDDHYGGNHEWGTRVLPGVEAFRLVSLPGSG